MITFIWKSLCNTKIPDLLVVMERARVGYLERFDALVLRLEGKVLSLVAQLRALGHRIVLEQGFTDIRDIFNALWLNLKVVFFEFCTHCESLGVRLYDVDCLVLTEDESLSSEGDESSSSEEEEILSREE